MAQDLAARRRGGGALAATIDELRSIALDAHDAAGHFPAMYSRVTAAVAEGIAGGRFEDPARMERFVVRFAARYLAARTDAPAPGSWRAAFDVAGDRRLLVVQHLLLGINAHVNFDLPQVVVELADEDGDLASLRNDFDAVNDVLAATYPVVLRDLGLVARWVNVAASAGGGRLFSFSLTVARAQAWRAATRLHGLDAEARRAEVAELDRLVRVLAYLVASPRPPVSLLVPIGRLLEARDPRAVTTALLGKDH